MMNKSYESDKSILLDHFILDGGVVALIFHKDHCYDDALRESRAIVTCAVAVCSNKSFKSFLGTHQINQSAPLPTTSESNNVTNQRKPFNICSYPVQELSPLRGV